MPPDLRRPCWTMCEPPASALGAPDSIGGLGTLGVSRDDVDTVDVRASGPPSVHSGVHSGGHVRSPPMSSSVRWSFVGPWRCGAGRGPDARGQETPGPRARRRPPHQPPERGSADRPPFGAVNTSVFDGSAQVLDELSAAEAGDQVGARPRCRAASPSSAGSPRPSSNRRRCCRAWGYAAALHPSIDGVAPSPAPRSLPSPHSSSISRSTE